VIHDAASLATPEEMAAIDTVNDRLQAARQRGVQACNPKVELRPFA
jgi:hypothetical protein